MLLISYPILFVLKKDGILKLYINYRQLNNIIIKNRYILSLILELMDKLKGKKYYIKLNPHKTYNLICIKEGEKWKIIFKIKYKYYEYIIILFKLTNTLVII